MSASLWRKRLVWAWKYFRSSYDFEVFMRMMNTGHFAEALSVLDKIIEKLPRVLDKSIIYIFWADLELGVNHDAERATELLDIAYEKDDLDMAFYYAVRGDISETKGQAEQAIQYYLKSIEADPHVHYRANLACLLSRMGDPAALRLWREILEESEDCMAYAFLSWELVKAGDHAGAQGMEETAEKVEGSILGTFGVAALYHHREDFPKAIKWYLKARRFGYGSKGVLYAALADCYTSLGDQRTATRYLSRAKKHDPDEKYVEDIAKIRKKWA